MRLPPLRAADGWFFSSLHLLLHVSLRVVNKLNPAQCRSLLLSVCRHGNSQTRAETESAVTICDVQTVFTYCHCSIVFFIDDFHHHLLITHRLLLISQSVNSRKLFTLFTRVPGGRSLIGLTFSTGEWAHLDSRRTCCWRGCGGEPGTVFRKPTDWSESSVTCALMYILTSDC